MRLMATDTCLQLENTANAVAKFGHFWRIDIPEEVLSFLFVFFFLLFFFLVSVEEQSGLNLHCLRMPFFSNTVEPMARTSFGPWESVRDIGSSSHCGLIKAPGQEANSDNLGKSSRFSTK